MACGICFESMNSSSVLRQFVPGCIVNFLQRFSCAAPVQQISALIPVIQHFAFIKTLCQSHWIRWIHLHRTFHQHVSCRLRLVPNRHRLCAHRVTPRSLPKPSKRQTPKRTSTRCCCVWPCAGRACACRTAVPHAGTLYTVALAANRSSVCIGAKVSAVVGSFLTLVPLSAINNQNKHLQKPVHQR